MPTENDPRIFFAAERTLLAWLRTGLAVIGIGFLVARFGLFMAIARLQPVNRPPTIYSTQLGILFVLLGSAMIGVAAWQQHRFCRDLPSDQKPNRYWLSFSVWMAGLLSLAGLALACYLVLSAAMDASLPMVFMFRAVPDLAAGIFSFERPMVGP